MAEFKSWPKIARLAREVVCTEKIDGTNAAIHIERLKFGATGTLEIRPGDVVDWLDGEATFLRLTAQSRTRLITVADDNHGFARWVADNAAAIAATLGEGIHYGEWWGYKINRGYGLAKGDKRFSLFNTERWSHLDGSQVPGLWTVPVLATGLLWDEDGDPFGMDDPVTDAVLTLREGGSVAAPGYDRPEGIVVFHTAGRVMFKYTLDGDEAKETKADPFALIRAKPEDFAPPMTRDQQIPLLEAIENQDLEAYQEAIKIAIEESGIVDKQYEPFTNLQIASNREDHTGWEGLV